MFIVRAGSIIYPTTGPLPDHEMAYLQRPLHLKLQTALKLMNEEQFPNQTQMSILFLFANCNGFGLNLKTRFHASIPWECWDLIFQ